MFNQETYKKRAVRNVFYLIARSGILQGINFFGAFILTIFLDPKVFGIYAVVSAMINFLNYFSDIGLAASLVQKKEEIERDELRCVFTIQQILVFSLTLIMIALSSFVMRFYKLDTAALWLFYALLVSFIFSSLKTIPSVLLERELMFEKLVIPQIAEALFFNVTAVFLAMRGYGVLAFAWAVFFRAIAGLIILYLIKPWPIGISFSFRKHIRHFKFGLPFQANSILAMLKDDLLTVFLGKILSLFELGIIGWGQKWAFMPLRFILDNVAKISFSALSRIQDEKEKLEKAVNKAIFGTSFLTFPILLLINIAAQFLVVAIPKYDKWTPALPYLMYFSINAAMACVFINLVNLLNSLGKVKLTLKLMVFWTILSWILNLLLIYFFGAIGVGAASVLMGFASMLVLYHAKKLVRVDYSSFLSPAQSAGAALVATLIVLPIVERTIVNMLIICVFTSIMYVLFSNLFFRKKLKEEFEFLKKNI